MNNIKSTLRVLRSTRVLRSKRELRSLSLLCFAFFFISCATPPYATVEGRTVPEDFFGMAPYRSELKAKDFQMLDELGSVWQRRTCRWSSLEKERGIWDFADWDKYVRDNKAAGKKILAILGYDTPWLAKQKGKSGTIGREELPYYLNYVEKVVSRYKGQIDAYEIWNEPNMLSLNWKGTKDEFYTMTAEAVKIIRQTDPEAKILAGSFWRTPKSFIKKMFKSGAMENVDAVSFHPYAVNPGGVVELYDKLQAVLDEEGFKGEVWITEVGYPTGGWYPTMVKEKNFPRDIVKTLGGLATRKARVLFWYELKDAHNKGKAPSRFHSEDFFGLVYPDYSLKNGYRAWELCSRHLSGASYDPHLPLRRNLSERTVSLYFKKPSGENALLIWNERGSDVRLQVSLPGTKCTLYNISTGEGSAIENEKELLATKNPLFITFVSDTENGADGGADSGADSGAPILTKL